MNEQELGTIVQALHDMENRYEKPSLSSSHRRYFMTHNHVLSICFTRSN